MYIKKGSNRVVFVFPKLGLVIKFPRIFIRKTVRTLGQHITEKRWKILRKELFSYSIEAHGTLRNLLFKGLKDNCMEFLFYWKTKNIAVEPTYFSFFGFFNIERYGKSEKIDFRAMGKVMVQTIGQEAVMKDGHHLVESDNFSFRGNKIRFRDYGGHRTQSIIREFGSKIFEGINIQKLREEHELIKQKPLIE